MAEAAEGKAEFGFWAQRRAAMGASYSILIIREFSKLAHPSLVTLPS